MELGIYLFARLDESVYKCFSVGRLSWVDGRQVATSGD